MKEREVIKSLKHLPSEPPFGPHPPPRMEWDIVNENITGRLGELFVATGGPVVGEACRPLAQPLLQDAALAMRDTYALWIKTAEEELISILGCSEASRGRGGDLEVVSALPINRWGKHHPEAPPLSRALLWAHDILKSLLVAFRRFASVEGRSETSFRHMTHFDRAARVLGRSPFKRLHESVREFWFGILRQASRLLSFTSTRAGEQDFNDAGRV